MGLLVPGRQIVLPPTQWVASGERGGPGAWSEASGGPVVRDVSTRCGAHPVHDRGAPEVVAIDRTQPLTSHFVSGSTTRIRVISTDNAEIGG